jgi:intein-encoded DNA endonuclease-like protein
MTPLQQLAEDRLGISLVKWMKKCRSAKMSHRDMATALKEATGIDVSKSSIFDWCRTSEVE